MIQNGQSLPSHSIPLQPPQVSLKKDHKNLEYHKRYNIISKESVREIRSSIPIPNQHKDVEKEKKIEIIKEKKEAAKIPYAERRNWKTEVGNWKL